MTGEYFIVEHPVHGVLVDLDETEGGNIGRFSWSGSRTEGARFGNVAAAIHALAQITPIKKRCDCQIRSSVPRPGGGPMGPHDWPVVK
jgi:hypothetical protein